MQHQQHQQWSDRSRDRRGESRAEQGRAGLGAGAAGGPKEKKVPSWEVVLGQTGRLGNYMGRYLAWVPGVPSLGKAGRQAGRYVIWSTGVAGA